MRRRTGAAVAVVAALALPACSASSAASDGKPQVIAAFYPFAYVAQQVAGSHADVTDLTQPGIEPHDVELKPQQVADISTADLVVYESGFQPAVDQAMQQNPPRAALNVANVVRLRPLEPTTGGSTTPDPHVWLDPTNMVAITKAVAAKLSQLDPHAAAAYHDNAARLIRRLQALDAAYRKGLASCQRTAFVTSHAAFGYLAARYGLHMIPVAGVSPDMEPSPQQIAALQHQIQADGITTVFSEPLSTSAYADSIASDLGLRSAVLDPIEGFTASDPHATYLSLMRANLAALQKANGCR